MKADELTRALGCLLMWCDVCVSRDIVGAAKVLYSSIKLICRLLLFPNLPRFLDRVGKSLNLPLV